ncbi:FtsW/RodA/SpoVE family cell cycle protein, partial [Pradoshia sp.]
VFFLIGAAILSALRWFPNTFINGEPHFWIPGVGALSCWAALPFFFLAWSQFFQDKRIKVWQLILLLIFSLYLFLLIPNLSITFIYGMMVMIMLWWSHLSKKTAFFLTAGSITIGIAGIASLFLFGREYQIKRLEASLPPYINPYMYIGEFGFTYELLKERMTGANWFGEAAQARSIPYLHTDFALSGLTSQFGYAAAIVVLLVLVLFVIRMAVIASDVRSGYGQLLVVGAVALFSLQFFYNIAMTFGLVPIISMSLPFISYGGMPTLFNAFLIGIVLSVYRRKQFAAMEDGGCRAK